MAYLIQHIEHICPEQGKDDDVDHMVIGFVDKDNSNKLNWSAGYQGTTVIFCPFCGTKLPESLPLPEVKWA